MMKKHITFIILVSGNSISARSIEEMYWRMIASEFPELFSGKQQGTTATLHTNQRPQRQGQLEQSPPVKPPGKPPVKKEPFTFKNLVGAIPQDVREVTDFIHRSDKYRKIGAQMPNGLLLVGPPGTGKTSIARAIAGEANAAFFSASGPEFVDKYVGEGARKVRELFEEARSTVAQKTYKKAIIFIDEIDSIAGTRGEQENMFKRDMLNELLAQMSGFNEDDSIFVIAATNRVFDIDPALKRPGRFDRIVEISAPDLESRKEILAFYLKKVKTDSSIDINKLAQEMNGATPADLKNLINESAIRAVRDHKSAVSMVHVQQALNDIRRRNRTGAI